MVREVTRRPCHHSGRLAIVWGVVPERIEQLPLI